jgi:hypothetical protein
MYTYWVHTKSDYNNFSKVFLNSLPLNGTQNFITVLTTAHSWTYLKLAK